MTQPAMEEAMPNERPTLATLERERIAIKQRLSMNMRWRHKRSGTHYILIDVVRSTDAVPTWCVLYAPAGEVNPVPFIRPVYDFEQRFAPVSGEGR